MIKPKSDKYHLLLYDGRYDGDDPKWFKKEIRQMCAKFPVPSL